MSVTIREIVERTRRKMNSADEEALYKAAERLEYRIAEINKRKPAENILPESEISAPGFDDMYEAYLLREVNLDAEDWDCYNMYSQIFNKRWEEYLAYIVRNTPAPERKFTDWRW